MEIARCQEVAGAEGVNKGQDIKGIQVPNYGS